MGASASLSRNFSLDHLRLQPDAPPAPRAGPTHAEHDRDEDADADEGSAAGEDGPAADPDRMWPDGYAPPHTVPPPHKHALARSVLVPPALPAGAGGGAAADEEAPEVVVMVVTGFDRCVTCVRRACHPRSRVGVAKVNCRA